MSFGVFNVMLWGESGENVRIFSKLNQALVLILVQFYDVQYQHPNKPQRTIEILLGKI
jgi:hypothetical protein